MFLRYLYKSTILIIILNNNHINAAEQEIKEQMEPIRLTQEQKANHEQFVALASQRDVELLPALLPSIIDINYKDIFGHTALMWAAIHGYDKIAELLLTAGANPDIKDNEGYTALMLAASYGYDKIAELLLKAGANPDITNIYSETALMLAAINGCDKIAELLLKAGANLYIMNNNGKTALTCAAQKGHDKSFRILKKYIEYFAEFQKFTTEVPESIAFNIYENNIGKMPREVCNIIGQYVVISYKEFLELKLLEERKLREQCKKNKCVIM